MSTHPTPSFRHAYLFHQCSNFKTTGEPPLLIHYEQVRAIVYSDCLNFCLTSIFCSRIPSRTPRHTSCRVFLGPLARTVSQTSRVFISLIVWRVLVIRHFVDCPSTGICLMLRSWLQWRYGFLGEEDHGYKLSAGQHGRCRPWSPGWGASGFCKATSFCLHQELLRETSHS